MKQLTTNQLEQIGGGLLWRCTIGNQLMFITSGINPAMNGLLVASDGPGNVQCEVIYRPPID